jgi:1-acyl-sn-glycerol-3-phosphate acyltransferase
MRQIAYNGLPVWLVIFPEGTRFNPGNSQDVIERSRQFAQQKGFKNKDFIY